MTYRLSGQAVTNGEPTARLAPWFRKLSRVLPSVLMKMFHLHHPGWVRDCGGLLSTYIPKHGPGIHTAWQPDRALNSARLADWQQTASAGMRCSTTLHKRAVQVPQLWATGLTRQGGWSLT